MGYANPEVLVDTAWVAEHLDDPGVRILEVDEDILLYDTGHVPGALKIDWQRDFWDPVVRDFVDERAFAELMGRLGIANDTTVVLYGDKSNWWAAYAFWFLRYAGHENLKLMNGGRAKWEAEGRPMTREVPEVAPAVYRPRYRNELLRAYRDEVLKHVIKVQEGRGALVDVRSPAEYKGELTHMPEYPQEGVLRGGHIPGAVNIPWAEAVQEDGTFKPFEELKKLYQERGVTPDKEVIVYCRIAERSSHTWFVLTYLLGYPKVKNYDGSWTEWGNLVGAPIKKGEAP
jgi:thiosulfate/3-mercaptopyruvate sulfurtransferase